MNPQETVAQKLAAFICRLDFGQIPAATISFNLAPGYSLGHAVDEQDAVEMVHLVLQADSEQAFNLFLVRLAFASFDEAAFSKGGFRVVPPAVARRGSQDAPTSTATSTRAGSMVGCSVGSRILASARGSTPARMSAPA